MVRPKPMEENDTEIIYVPGAYPKYDFEYDVVILPRDLKEYPKAHDVILEHELEHAKSEKQWFIPFLKMELETDLRHFLSDEEEIQEVRDYFEQREPPSPIPSHLFFQFTVANTIRLLASLIIRPIGMVYRAIRF